MHSVEADVQALNTRRAWVIDQLSALVRNGAVPKSDAWIQTILDWLAVHGLFIIAKKSEKGAVPAVSLETLPLTCPAPCSLPHARGPEMSHSAPAHPLVVYGKWAEITDY